MHNYCGVLNLNNYIKFLIFCNHSNKFQANCVFGASIAVTLGAQGATRFFRASRLPGGVILVAGRQARLPRLPCQEPDLLLKNSVGPASEEKPALARKRTTVGWRPPRTMTPPALILAAGRRVASCPPRVW